MVGEASLALATLCFGDAMTGNNGHGALDVLYLAFTGPDAVPGADGADWTATSPDAFEASLESLGATLLARIGGGAPGGATASGTAAASLSSSSSPSSSSSSSAPPSTTTATGNCSWSGHCAGKSFSRRDFLFFFFPFPSSKPQPKEMERRGGRGVYDL